MLIKKLHGHSGCTVLLLRLDERLTVRKISPSEQYDIRIDNQRDKQGCFRSSMVQTPQIYDSGIVDKRRFFDMEFINGQTFSNFIEHGDQKSIFQIFEKLFDFVNKNNYIDETVEYQVLNKIENMPLTNEYNLYRDYCLDFDWSKIKKSYCHGDLTFENVMISNGEIYFIDFLDSFTSSKVIDYSKMLQDIILGWSWRDKNSKPYIKLIRMHEHMVKNMKDIEYEASKRMLVLSMLRILPYSVDTKTIDLINRNLKFIKREFINE
tara:strand:+ start:2011 stop:2805 length:795 start_codon:yes stop_codon:yes gene_type:complete